MTYRTEVEVHEPAVHEHAHERTVVAGPSPLGVLTRLVVFLFGLIQLVIGLRIVLLLFAARESNSIVAAIYNVSEIFVAPFRGIFGVRELEAGASTLDIWAIVALIAWVIIELVVLALIRVFRPTTTV